MPILTLDAETFYSADYSLSKMTTTEYVMDERFHCWGAAAKIDAAPAEWVPGDQLPILFDRLRASGKEWMLLGQNTMFDAAIYAWHYGWTPDQYIDIMGMSRAIIGPRIASHSLHSQCQYWGLPGKAKAGALHAMKGNRNPTQYDLYQLGLYACDDSNQTYDIWMRLHPHFPLNEYAVLDWTIRMFAEPQLQLDPDVLTTLYNEEVARRATLLQRVGLDITTIRSNEKFAEVLDSLGVDPPMKISKVTGKPTYAFSKQDQEFVELLNDPDPDIATLVEARLGLKSSIVETRTATYYWVSQVMPDLWPVDLQYSGAQQTHRLSGGSGGGGNVQNLNRKGGMRNSIKARKGKVCVVADSSQIELRVSAKICGQQDIIDALVTKSDLYSSFASDVYGRPIDKNNDPDERQTGKIAVLQLGYNAAAKTFKRSYAVETRKTGKPLTVTLGQAQVIVDKYRQRFSCFPDTWKALSERLTAMCAGQVPLNLPTNPPLTWGQDYIMGPSGLCLKYPEIGWRQVPDPYVDGAFKNAVTFRSMAKGKSNKSGFKSIYGGALLENLSQFLAREIMTAQAQIIMDAGIPWPAMQVHDELVFVVDPAEAPAVAAYVTQVMSTPVSFWPDLPLNCEVGIHEVYGKAK